MATTPQAGQALGSCLLDLSALLLTAAQPVEGAGNACPLSRQALRYTS